jgi:hypothetical protein
MYIGTGEVPELFDEKGFTKRSTDDTLGVTDIQRTCSIQERHISTI